MEQNRKVVITGIGIASSMGVGNEEFIQMSESFNTSVTEEQVNTIASEMFGANIIRRMDTLSKYGILSSKLAYEDAKLNEVENEIIGGIFSTVWGPFNRTFEYHKNVLKKGASGASPLFFPSTVTNAVVGRIAKQLNLKGVSSMLVGTCPVNYAYQLIKENKANIVLAGGMDDLKEHLPAHPLRRKDNKVASTEGSFILVLEEKENALRRGIPIYAEIENACLGNVFLNDYIEKAEINSQVIHSLLDKSRLTIKEQNNILASSMQEVLQPIDLKNIEHGYYVGLNGKINYRNDKLTNKVIFPFGAVSVVNLILSCFILQDHKPVLKSISANDNNNNAESALINSYFYSGCVSTIAISKSHH
jgi:hypothetical protein